MAWLFKMPLWMKLVSVTSIKIPAATLFQGKTYWGGNTTHENPMTAREQTNGRQSRQKETKGVKKKNYCESINRRKYKEPPPAGYSTAAGLLHLQYKSRFLSIRHCCRHAACSQFVKVSDPSRTGGLEALGSRRRM